jgi:hypothetical protein
VEDFFKFCGLLRISELYIPVKMSQNSDCLDTVQG